MRAVIVTGPGVVELNWMFLPTFCGHDMRLRQELEKELAPELMGRPLSDETLDFAHHRVIDLICKKHHAIKGLRDYLDAVKFIDEKGSG